MSDSDWDRSAAAWIASQGTEGDWLRCNVLDHALKALLADRGFAKALDVGCGEGRLFVFCVASAYQRQALILQQN